MTRVAILRYPGTWSERDFAHALSLIEGVESEIQWHEDVDLRHFDAAIVPGGFSYGDYLRAGAIAKLSPGTQELRRFAAEGGAILGSCNGFQILCEAGLLPGALIRNADLAYRSDWVRIRVEDERTPFTAELRGAVLRMPIGNGDQGLEPAEREIAHPIPPSERSKREADVEDPPLVRPAPARGDGLPRRLGEARAHDPREAGEREQDEHP